MEVGVDLVGGIVRSDHVVAKFEREARLGEIEQFARDLPPFAPPTVGVDQGRAIVRRQLESLGHRVLVAEAATEALLLVTGPGAPDLMRGRSAAPWRC